MEAAVDVDDFAGRKREYAAHDRFHCPPDILRAIELRAQAAALLADADALEAAAKVTR